MLIWVSSALILFPPPVAGDGRTFMDCAGTRRRARPQSVRALGQLYAGGACFTGPWARGPKQVDPRRRSAHSGGYPSPCSIAWTPWRWTPPRAGSTSSRRSSCGPCAKLMSIRSARKSTKRWCECWPCRHGLARSWPRCATSGAGSRRSTATIGRPWRCWIRVTGASVV